VTEYGDDFTDLLGAYALDAVDPDEAARIADHLRTCSWCRDEVAEFREVAAMLSQSGSDAPAGVWDRIVAELSPEAPPMRLTLSPPAPAGSIAPPKRTAGGGVDEEPGPAGSGSGGSGADPTVVPFARPARTPFISRRVAAIAAAAACLVLGLGIVAVNQQRRIDRLETAASRPDTGGSALRVALAAKGSDHAARAVVERDGEGYLLVDDLPPTEAGRVYQLWGVVDGTVLSLGTFGGDTDMVRFHIDPSRIDGVEAFAVTDEVAPGVVASKEQPVVAGTV
jgi:anti-sigma factor RsiW